MDARIDRVYIALRLYRYGYELVPRYVLTSTSVIRQFDTTGFSSFSIMQPQKTTSTLSWSIEKLFQNMMMILMKMPPPQRRRARHLSPIKADHQARSFPR